MFFSSSLLKFSQIPKCVVGWLLFNVFPDFVFSVLSFETSNQAVFKNPQLAESSEAVVKGLYFCIFKLNVNIRAALK